VKRVLIVAALLLAAVAARVDVASSATSECRGFLTCVPVAGPWVVLPASQGTQRPQVQFQLTCPKGFIVGGVDAELSDRAIDVWILGATGSPISPGRTTSRSVVFVATYVGSGARAPTFRPHAGCIPGGGGGRRTPTAYSAVFPPGKPTVRRVRTIRVNLERSYAARCRSGERLVAAYSARGFRTAKPPTPELVNTLSARTTVTASRITAAVKGGAGRGVVQIAAVCAGGK
jgi:hypothetical protein